MYMQLRGNDTDNNATGKQGTPSKLDTASQNTKGEVSPTPNPSNPSTPPDKESGNQSSGAKPITPTGNFVSNHNPNLSGSPTPNTEESVCNTTPGAKCEIIFTKDGITKSLPAQTTDNGGAAYWNWKLQDVGLTEGSWKVTAKATLGSQMVTADDAVPLVVSQ